MESVMRFGLSTSNRGDFVDRTSFPAQSSVLDEEALFHRVVPLYDLPAPDRCLFYSRGDSDIYQIWAVGPTYYLKIYRPPDSLEKAEAEARLVTQLLARGASAVPAVPRRDGAFATPIAASEGTRIALVFAEAPARPIVVSSPELCRRLGAAVAHLHTAGDSVDGIEIEALEEPDLLCFAERLAYPEDYAELVRLQARFSDRLEKLLDASADSDIGWCHGDLALCNIRVREDGSVVFFDFGNARYMPRAAELARVRSVLTREVAPERANELWDVFEEGYSSVRPVPLATRSDLPWRLYAALQRIAWIGGVMASCPLRMGTENFSPEWVREQLRDVRQSTADILG
jgi:Ser/Thr protein kinase RdoA (MazF antagonist)